MTLRIETFSNETGGACLFKALSHPLAAAPARALRDRLERGGPIAIYDPLGHAAEFAEIYPLEGAELADYFVQKVESLGSSFMGKRARPVHEIGTARAAIVFIAAFDAARFAGHIRHLVPARVMRATLDDMRLPERFVTNAGRYLDPVNFATNFAFFRDASGLHTRLASANYWHRYGARGVRIWAQLFDAGGTALAQWEETLADGDAAFVIDSKDVRTRFGLGEFTGQLFLHVLGVKGHDVVKYALDVYGDDDTVLSATHDANAWPADFYAGLPAPGRGETVTLWVQNSFPCPIPRSSIALNPMGDARAARLEAEIPAFGTHALDVASLLPDLAYPGQIEIHAGRHFVRPRYEIRSARGRLRMAHVNVERADLKPDPRIAKLGNLMGRGYLLPAPVLPPDLYASAVLPTPMSTAQAELPVALAVHDPDGGEIVLHRFGNLLRSQSVWLELDQILARAARHDYGHMALHYDFAAGTMADGWLHAIFRYRDRASGHCAETSFGAHIFNTVLTFGREPQSYAGSAPGLSTRLFLRLGHNGTDTFCHLIYPASTPWHERSTTDLILHDAAGAEVARRRLAIPCNGSRLWRASEMFSADDLRRAAGGGYVIVRDETCRLFGYHGLVNGRAFSLDHMFGF